MGASASDPNTGNIKGYDPLLKNPKLLTRKQLKDKIMKLRNRITTQKVFP